MVYSDGNCACVCTMKTFSNCACVCAMKTFSTHQHSTALKKRAKTINTSQTGRPQFILVCRCKLRSENSQILLPNFAHAAHLEKSSSTLCIIWHLSEITDDKIIPDSLGQSRTCMEAGTACPKLVELKFNKRRLHTDSKTQVSGFIALSRWSNASLHRLSKGRVPLFCVNRGQE